MQAVIYCRVSTKEQKPQTQLREVRAYARRRGFEVAHEFIDLKSGMRDDRPNFLKLLELARKGQVDVVLVWKFDRFARSSQRLVSSLNEFRSLGVDFISCTEQIDTNTPWGKMAFTALAGFAEFESDLLSQRVRAGLARARAEGKHPGRPPLPVGQVLQLRKLQRRGLSNRRVAARLGISEAVVRKYAASNQNQRLR